jgi:hypothetical protein
MIAFLPAIIEEWAFRGVLLRSLLPYGKVFALVVSSVTFGLMHVNPPQALFAISFGFLAGFIYIKTGSIWYGSIIHLINNAFSATASFANAYRGVQSPELIFLSLIIISIIICAIVALIIFLQKGFFKTGILHSITPPDKPKLAAKQYLSLALLNPITVMFAVFYTITLIIRYYPEI